MAYPKELMHECCWSFSGAPYDDQRAFETKFASYQKDIRGIESWDPNTLAFDGPTIKVEYECWEGDDQITPMVSLTAADGKAFTEGELMFQLHNAVVHQLDQIDHHFFEGLSLMSDNGNAPPLYSLNCGS